MSLVEINTVVQFIGSNIHVDYFIPSEEIKYNVYIYQLIISVFTTPSLLKSLDMTDMTEMGGGGNRKSTVTHLRTDHCGSNQLMIIWGEQITSSG